jgi:hypothetical protein
MARTFTAAPGLVKLMSGQPWESVGLPDVYQITSSRLETLNKAFCIQGCDDLKSRRTAHTGLTSRSPATTSTLLEDDL